MGPPRRLTPTPLAPISRLRSVSCVQHSIARMCRAMLHAVALSVSNARPMFAGCAMCACAYLCSGDGLSGHCAACSTVNPNTRANACIDAASVSRYCVARNCAHAALRFAFSIDLFSRVRGASVLECATIDRLVILCNLYNQRTAIASG